VSSIDLPEAREAREIFQRGLIIAAEAYTNNKRWLQNHFEELDPVVAFRMIKGKDISANEYLEDKLKSERLQFEVHAKLRDIDALLVPATFIPAMPVGEVDWDNSTYTEINLSYLRNTSIGNILNLCGLAVPCGFSEKGLPVGLMIYGKSFQEDVVLRTGYAFQQTTDWHTRLPALPG
jgi:aspartyl-tRNA(Asn)/glutamyl-tRNA(Gln) amidotransferase subunit A